MQMWASRSRNFDWCVECLWLQNSWCVQATVHVLGPAELCFGPSANNFGHTGILEMRESEAELKQTPPAGDHRTFTAMMLAKRTVTVKVPGLLRNWPAAAGPTAGPIRGVSGHGALRPAGGAKSADHRARGGGLPAAPAQARRGPALGRHAGRRQLRRGWRLASLIASDSSGPRNPRCPGIGIYFPDPGKIGISDFPNPGFRPNRDGAGPGFGDFGVWIADIAASKRSSHLLRRANERYRALAY